MITTYGFGQVAASQGAVLIAGRSTPLNGTRRGVVYGHGGGTKGVSAATSSPYNAQMAALADCGYPIIAADNCGATYQDAAGNPWNWGNSDAVTQVGTTVTALGTMGAKTDKVCLFGESMGAAVVLNYYKANPTKVLAIALGIPLLDLNDLASNDKGFIFNSLASTVNSGATTLPLNNAAGFSAATGVPGLGTGTGANLVNLLLDNGTWCSCGFTGISTNTLTGVTGVTGTASAGARVSQGYGACLVNGYGHAWPTQLAAGDLTASSPIVWAATAGALTVPVKIWASDNDMVAATTAVANTFAANVAAAGGGNVTPVVESIGAVGHTVNALPVLELVQWFDANGGRS